MHNYRYLIVGAGMTADAAARGIRELDDEGSIGIVGAEHHPPYDRPPLSKDLWKGGEEAQIWRAVEETGAQLHLGVTVERLEPASHEVVCADGTRIGYEKLLLATGGSPRRLDIEDDSAVNYFRGLEDYHRLRKACEAGKRFAVIGGGFIGSEIAAALAMNEREVSLVFPGEAIGDNVYPADLAHHLNKYYAEKGVDVRPGQRVTAVAGAPGDLTVTVRGERGEETLAVDGVVAGIGIMPNVGLAREAGLELDVGISVDADLRTSVPDIYAAGDVASYYNRILGKRVRVEHEDNANTMGRAAGHAMTGAAVDYQHLSYFYSDLFDLGYEAVGELDPTLETVGDWQELFRKGVVYYLDNERVRGVLLWNVWDQVEAARELISEDKLYTAAGLKGRLPR